MNVSSSAHPGRYARRRWLLVVAGLSAVGLTMLWLWFAGLIFPGESNPMFRGRPESEWIANLQYLDDEQVKEWRGYGEDGVQVLVRGLSRSIHPGERAYRATYRRLPGFLARWLPAPKPDSTRSTRMCVVSLLSSLANDARSATPTMIRTVQNDEAASVRQLAISFFTGGEDDQCLLNQLPAGEKAELLPALLRDLKQAGDWGVRNNAANALRWCPERPDLVVPALTNALHDPQPQVAVLAAEALNRIDPESARRAGVIAVLAAIANHPDDQIATRAVATLRKMKFEPEHVVPVLLAGMRNTNSLVACQSVWALEWGTRDYAPQADDIVPALREVSAWTNSVGRYARVALGRWTNAAIAEVRK